MHFFFSSARYFTSAALICLLYGCSATKTYVPLQESSRPGQNLNGGLAAEQSPVYTHFIRGVTALQLDDFEGAKQHLAAAQRLDPHSAGILYALADLHMQLKDYASSIHFGQLAAELEPQNKWYRMQLVEVLSAKGEYREVVRHLDELLEYHPGDIDILFRKARIQAAQGDYNASNATYQLILDLTGPDRSIHYQRISNFTRLEDNDAIITELNRLLKLDQSNINTLLMLSQFYLEQDQIQEARETLEKVLERNPRHPESLLNLADIYINEGEWSRAGNLLTDLVSDTLVSTTSKLEIVQYVISRFSGDRDNQQLQETTRMLVENLLESEPDFGLAHAMAAEFFMILNDTVQALIHLKKTTDLIPENDAAWRQLIQIYYVEGRYDDAIRIGKTAGQFVPEDVIIFFFIGGSYLLKEDYSQAAEWLRSASSLPSRPEFQSIILGSLGDTYASLDSWDEAAQAYEEAMLLDPDNDVVLNNYAYYLAERGQQLEKAKSMARRALELNPENAAFLDTMGWIFYKMGDYPEAYSYIKASVNTGEASAEVMEHLGDVYNKLGNSEKAYYWWRKALEKDETRTYLRERLHIP